MTPTIENLMKELILTFGPSVGVETSTTDSPDTQSDLQVTLPRFMPSFGESYGILPAPLDVSAVKDYFGPYDRYLTLRAQDKVTVHMLTNDKKWAIGYNHRTNLAGGFPMEFVNQESIATAKRKMYAGKREGDAQSGKSLLYKKEVPHYGGDHIEFFRWRDDQQTIFYGLDYQTGHIGLFNIGSLAEII